MTLVYPRVSSTTRTSRLPPVDNGTVHTHVANILGILGDAQDDISERLVKAGARGSKSLDLGKPLSAGFGYHVVIVLGTIYRPAEIELGLIVRVPRLGAAVHLRCGEGRVEGVASRVGMASLKQQLLVSSRQQSSHLILAQTERHADLGYRQRGQAPSLVTNQQLPDFTPTTIRGNHYGTLNLGGGGRRHLIIIIIIIITIIGKRNHDSTFPRLNGGYAPIPLDIGTLGQQLAEFTPVHTTTKVGGDDESRLSGFKIKKRGTSAWGFFFFFFCIC